MKPKRLTATDALLQAITECGLPFIELERRTGVKRQSIMKFARRERTMYLDAADKLMEALGVTVQLGPIPTAGKVRKPR
jgi:hypothetical protein